MELPPSQYFDAKYRCADAMLNRIEENFPGLRSHIEEVEVATPLTFMRYLGHPNGAIYGFHRYAKDIPFTKASSFSPGSDIRGLYSAGAWVGDLGYPATYLSGVMAAEAVLKDLKA
jgi:prolycopene isomerase